jgi:hypothetical protein
LRVEVSAHDRHDKGENASEMKSPVFPNVGKAADNFGTQEDNFLIWLQRQDNVNFLSFICDSVVDYASIVNLYEIDLLSIPAEDGALVEVLASSFVLSRKTHAGCLHFFGGGRIL